MKDVIIIGAGPVGLACAIEAQINNLDYLVIDKGCLTNSIYNFPLNITFFSTPDLLTIGNVPFITTGFRPDRIEVLNYYRNVVDLYGLNVKCYAKVIDIMDVKNGFDVVTEPLHSSDSLYKAKHVIIATGYHDNANMLNIKGEKLSKISHYYKDAHQYHGMDVAVIGGNNSAAEAALDLYRHGANVTLVHRSSDLGEKVKYWIAPELKNRIKDGSVKCLFDTNLTEIKKDTIVVSSKGDDGPVETGELGESQELKNDFVFAMTGYRPDIKMLKKFGLNYCKDSLIPEHSEDCHETNRKGIFLAGSILCGIKNNSIFIETGRFHGKKIIDYIVKSS
ncbi:MAG: YpdA family putative bacillithiol disulfide reductase [Candidatus Anammoxibacter sp.]